MKLSKSETHPDQQCYTSNSVRMKDFSATFSASSCSCSCPQVGKVTTKSIAIIVLVSKAPQGNPKRGAREARVAQPRSEATKAERL